VSIVFRAVRVCAALFITAIAVCGTAQAAPELWVARNFNNGVIFDLYPFGPSQGNSTAHKLMLEPDEVMPTSDLLGFQFVPAQCRPGPDTCPARPSMAG
jgi:hypothetical protein